jgi:hypothetical protein
MFDKEKLVNLMKEIFITNLKKKDIKIEPAV